MKRYIVPFMMVLLIAGVAFAKDYEVKKKVGGYDVEAKIDKNPPVVGENNITVSVKEQSGKAVTDAKVKVHYSMPAMPGMAPMSYETDASMKGEEYKAKMDLSMAGPWNIEVKITRSGKTSTMKFSIDAR